MSTDAEVVGPFRRFRRSVMRSVLTRVATVYTAGDDVKDARRVADTWARRGIPATFGFWDDSRDTPRDVANQSLLGLHGLGPEEYLSIKLTALDYSEALLEELAARRSGTSACTSTPCIRTRPISRASGSPLRGPLGLEVPHRRHPPRALAAQPPRRGVGRRAAAPGARRQRTVPRTARGGSSGGL